MSRCMSSETRVPHPPDSPQLRPQSDIVDCKRRIYAETTAATLQRRFDELTNPAAHTPVAGIRN